jgi:hypothetical protein
MPNNIKFITSENIAKEWENTDVWISDSSHILEQKPSGKEFIQFRTTYNQFFTYEKIINKLSDITITDGNILINTENEQKLLDSGTL